MPCPSYSGIASKAPPPSCCGGLSLYGLSPHTLGQDQYFSLPLRCPRALSCFHLYAYILLIPHPVVMCWLGVFYSLLAGGAPWSLGAGPGMLNVPSCLCVNPAGFWNTLEETILFLSFVSTEVAR